MRRRTVFAAVVGAALVVLLPGAAEGVNGHANYRAVCPAASAGFAHCQELVVTDERGNPLASSSPTGLDPTTIKSVYNFSTSLSAGSGTIAIVDAYDDPTAESDLGVFSSQYGLPACTTANGCFQKVNQSGGASYPKSNSGWALEISLDVQWAHAIAPGAKILLVEASSNSFTNLLAAEDYAKTHAQYVSNSWGASEFSGESAYDSNFVQSGVSFFVSAGDSGLPAEYPSASPNVISVGGTTLNFDKSGNFVSETGWSSGGGGCSAYETATSAQKNFSQYAQVNCGGARATPDVSLDADPNSGVSVYDSTPYYGQTGWFTVGGTSASSPMWAARSADQGTLVNSAYVYGNNISFRDITSGNNGAPCLVGYDLCTGRGSWTGGGSTTTTLPGAPTSLTATAGDTVVHLSWTAPVNDGGSTITGYNVYRGTSSGGESTTPIATVSSGTSYDDTTINDGITYYYLVSAVNAVGTGPASNEASATPQASGTAPTPPTNLTAVTAKGKGVQLSWTASTDPSVTSYNIYRSGASSGPFAVIASTTGTSYKDTSTVRGAWYYYEVTAVNSSGIQSAPDGPVGPAQAK